MKKKESGASIFKTKATFLAVALSVCILFAAGCGGAVYEDASAETAESSSADMAEDIGFQGYEDVVEDFADEEIADEEIAEPEEAESGTGEDAGRADSGGEDAQSPDGQEKILVYEGSVGIETMEFEGTVRAFKKAVQECGGFLEDEQSYGAGSQYAEESYYGARNPKTFLATARIPSEKYQDFMEMAEGLGKVTESNSKVTNMTRQYGTLKAELEIYEAEYDRYLKMFDEVSDDKAMLAVQEKLTELSLEIARTKSEMAAIDTDAMYSTVNVRVYEVEAYKENGAGFSARLRNVLSESWEGMLGFFEGILFFFILNWYKLLLLALIIFLIVKFVKKYQKEKNLQRRQIVQSYEANLKESVQGEAVQEAQKEGQEEIAQAAQKEGRQESAQEVRKEDGDYE